MIKSSKHEGDDDVINQVTLVGRLTKDPEKRITSEGTAVAQVTLAVNRNFRNQNGEIDTDFVQCTLWRRAAENTCQYCRKGSVIGITGRLQSRFYDNKDGKRVYVTEVVAETVRFLSSRPQDAAPAATTTASPASTMGSAPASRTAAPTTESIPVTASAPISASSTVAAPSTATGAAPVSEPQSTPETQWVTPPTFSSVTASTAAEKREEVELAF